MSEHYPIVKTARDNKADIDVNVITEITIPMIVC